MVTFSQSAYEVTISLSGNKQGKLACKKQSHNI
jgi:hypothetical protein